MANATPTGFRTLRGRQAIMKIKSVIIEDRIVAITPEIVARLFWDMFSDEQATFFNSLCAHESLLMQLQYVSTSENLSQGGRMVMAKIGEYAEPGIKP